MISKFSEIYGKRHEMAQQWKEKGKKIFGYFCTYVPEELIHAAGAIPVRIRGSTERISQAEAHFQSFTCHFSRSLFDEALKGRYHYLDGVVIPRTCDIIRDLYSIWARNIKTPYIFFLAVPGKVGGGAEAYFRKELERFKQSLEMYLGRKIKAEDIFHAIQIYNENRRLLEKLYECRKQEPSPISGSQVFIIGMAGLVMPKQDHNELLEEFLDNLQAIGRDRKRARIMLTGNTFENPMVIELIEQMGGEVVMDDLDMGTRYFWGLVPSMEDPLEALSHRYLRKIPCPCKHSPNSRIDYMLRWVKDYKVDGIISICQKFCDPYLFEYPTMREKIEEEGIPLLFIETEDSPGEMSQMRTRIQAFIEMLAVK